LKYPGFALVVCRHRVGFYLTRVDPLLFAVRWIQASIFGIPSSQMAMVIAKSWTTKFRGQNSEITLRCTHASI